MPDAVRHRLREKGAFRGCLAIVGAAMKRAGSHLDRKEHDASTAARNHRAAKLFGAELEQGVAVVG